MEDKKLVILNKSQIKEITQSGDTCNGMWYLAVSLKGIPRIHFMETKHQWKPWDKDDYTIGIPSLYGEGSEGEYEAAIEIIEDVLKLDFNFIQVLCTEQDIALYDYVSEYYPQDLADREEVLTDYYLEMFIEVCNGLDGAMDDLLTWGFTIDEYDNMTWIQPPFTFEWRLKNKEITC